MRSLRWARRATFDPEMEFVFDSKLERNEETRAVFHAFQAHEQDKRVAKVSSEDSASSCALQAGDFRLGILSICSAKTGERHGPAIS